MFSCSTQGAVAALAAAFTWRDRRLLHKSTLEREAKLVDLRKWNIGSAILLYSRMDTADVDRKQENRLLWDGKDSVTPYQIDQSEPLTKSYRQSRAQLMSPPPDLAKRPRNTDRV